MKSNHYYCVSVLLCTICFTLLCSAACTPSPTNMSLKEAAYWGNLESVKKNLQAHSNINETDGNGYTPLLIATYHNNHNIVVYLLDNGADVDQRGKDGRTALILATCNMNTKMIKTILKYSPDLDITDIGGFTALDHAKELNLQTISNLLESDKTSKNE